MYILQIMYTRFTRVINITSVKRLIWFKMTGNISAFFLSFSTYNVTKISLFENYIINRE